MGILRGTVLMDDIEHGLIMKMAGDREYSAVEEIEIITDIKKLEHAALLSAFLGMDLR
jgi:hypothetical protein